MSLSSLRKAADAIFTPSWVRIEDGKPPQISLGLNILFAFAGGFSCACLFYSHPILHVLAEDFHTTQSGVANIPTMAQAGEATCLLLIMPLADFVPRRKFTLVTVMLATSFWLGLCLTSNLTLFNALTYLSALFTCVVQIVIPLVSELSSPEKRAFNLSIIGLGPTLGILLARILSGVVANYTSWRNVYWMGFGIQLLILTALWLFMPDYPPIQKRTPRQIVTSYPNILFSIVRLYWKHPVLVQACLLAFISFLSVIAYWTTLTFLLSSAPYHYDTAAIGLFGLIGAVTLLLGPLFGKFMITPLRVPAYSALIGNTLSLVGIILGTFLGKHTVAGPVLEAILLDAGLIVIFIANRLRIEGIEPGANNRVNTAFMVVMHLGQLTGTKGANQIYEMYNGWVSAGIWAIGITVLGYVVIVARGPNERGWVGWRGGWRYRKDGESIAEERVDQEKGISEVKASEVSEKVSIESR